MLPWIVRVMGALVFGLAVLLGLEVGAVWFEARTGIPTVAVLPLSIALLVWIGWYVVRRVHLAWGVLTGALLYGTTALLAIPLKNWFIYGRLAMPREASALFIAAAVVVMVLIGTLAGLGGGLLARRRRRERRRRMALDVLASSSSTVLEPQVLATIGAADDALDIDAVPPARKGARPRSGR
ncbi:MAG: hypothetical protein MUF21_10465 [Gemmatimonadaceae bacterium]|nr:hypothetical protein [Gemmatimonadaceae bacterium]